MALIDNLVSYWKLDESSGNAADAHGSNTLTNTNTVTFVAAKLNNGADFERTSTQYFTIADASQTGLDLSAALSFSLWYKPESQPGSGESHYFQTKTSNSNESYFFAYRNNAGTPQLRLGLDDSPGNGTVEDILAVSQTLSDATWYFIAVTWDGSTKTAKFYVNATQVGGDQVGTAVASLFNGAAPFQLGQNPRDSVNTADGVMDEVGVWSRVLTSTEVTELYNSGTPLAYPFASAFIPRIMMS